MADQNETGKQAEPGKENEDHESVKAGKKAIDVQKKIIKQEKPGADADAEEKKDAEQWRNEG